MQGLPMELVETAQAMGRVTAIPITAPFALPSFSRSAVDGYAVRAADTYGASEALPVYLSVVGEAPMGATPAFSLAVSQSAVIHTGGMVPQGADAVIMVEYTQSVRQGEVEILRAVAVGENILLEGEDVVCGQEVIPAGARLRPAEIGGLMALGLTHLQVARRPSVGILSSGDEVVPPEAELLPGQVYDVNSYSLSALVEQAGGVAVRYGVIPDQADVLRQVAAQALEENDMLLITAGSSASARDLTADVINELGHPGVLVHGVNVRPGKPTILAVCQEKAVIGLPGNPVSALVIAYLFVVPLIEKLLGLRRIPSSTFSPSLGFSLSTSARLALNVPSQAGREDWVAVRLVQKESEIIAEPIFGKSNLIFTLVRADGLVRIPPAATGLEAGERVEVILI
jgi:molybdopterin molybdotransferase